MGRFDDLLTLDKKSAQPPPLPEKTEPVQPAPLSKDYLVSKPTNQQTDLPVNLQARKPASTQASKQVSLQTSLHANQQTSKDASRQAGKPTNIQTGKLVSLQSGKQVFIEKYSSYLPHGYKRELKRIALDTDREGYEVLIEAVEQYLTQQKHLK